MSEAKAELANWAQKIRKLWPQRISAPMAIIYDKVAVPGLIRFHQNVAAEITSSLTHGAVLDMGTGPGHLLVEIARRSSQLNLTGIDLSIKMLEMAKASIQRDTDRTVITPRQDQNAPESDPRSIRLVHGNVKKLPFDDGTFDLVVSTLSIHHWHDPARGISECARVTAPGGRCWIYDLRTDVWPKSYDTLITGNKAARMILGWIFRFHGIKPRRFQPSILASSLDPELNVQADLHEGYVKLIIEKPPFKAKHHIETASSSQDISSQSPPALATQYTDFN